MSYSDNNDNDNDDNQLYFTRINMLGQRPSYLSRGPPIIWIEVLKVE